MPARIGMSRIFTSKRTSAAGVRTPQETERFPEVGQLALHYVKARLWRAIRHFHQILFWTATLAGLIFEGRRPGVTGLVNSVL
jgi:hypothetical protein